MRSFAQSGCSPLPTACLASERRRCASVFRRRRGAPREGHLSRRPDPLRDRGRHRDGRERPACRPSRWPSMPRHGHAPPHRSARGGHARSWGSPASANNESEVPPKPAPGRLRREPRGQVAGRYGSTTSARWRTHEAGTRRFRSAEQTSQQAQAGEALTTLYAEWSRSAPKDEPRLAEFQRLVTMSRDRSSGETREKAGASARPKRWRLEPERTRSLQRNRPECDAVPTGVGRSML
jgi:hypothetical protein